MSLEGLESSSLEDFGILDMSQIEARRHQVDDMPALREDGAVLRDARRPANDKRRGDSPLVGEMFVPAKWRIRRVGA